MEERLKRERNRLILRITLILLAVWLTVSAVFCAVRLNTEKTNVQSSELSNLSYIKQMVLFGGNSREFVRWFYLEDSEARNGQTGIVSNMQIIVSDSDTKQVLADTADSLVLSFTAKAGVESAVDYIGILDYHSIRDALSDRNYQTMTDLLSTEREDGNTYELICTRLQLRDIHFIPLELKIVAVNGSDTRFIAEDNVAVFELDSNLKDGEEILESSDIRRNTIPKEFVLSGKGNRDIIGSLTKEQRKNTVDMIHTEALRYIFYASDLFNLGEPADNGENSAQIIQYAREVDLFENCKKDLGVGVALIFGFFLTIAVILCVMIWHTVKGQLVQEQKRLDLTNALAHDIKTPLFVISGYAYSLKEDIDETERDLYLDKIIEQTDEVNHLVHRMLTFSKLDSYSMTLRKTEFDLCGLMEEILQNYTALPDNKKIDYQHSGDNTVKADRELMKTALQNLIDNAAKYSLPDSAIQISVRDRVVEISNESEPMTKEELRQIQQPYVRKDKSRHQKGNGLGLSIVKSILDLHKARFDMSIKDSALTCRIDVTSH